MLSHTFSSSEWKRLELQLSKFANVILLGFSAGRIFCEVVHLPTCKVTKSMLDKTIT
jgi:hypothetical protein